MRKRSVEFGRRILLAAALLAAPPGCRSTAIPTGDLTGTVQEADTTAPVEGAAVTVGAATTQTDSAGHFALADLEVGERPATVNAPGYATLSKTVTIAAGDNATVFQLHRRQLDGGTTDGSTGDGPGPCKAVGEACEGGGDCCSMSCVSGFCASLTCSGSTCTYGYTYGGCCSAAPYCANAYGASTLVCRSTCGATSERCAYGSDCCSGTCSSGYCAAASCSGTACTYGYAYGQCCATEPYCVNYSAATSLVCRSTCGATNERCGYHSDCCNGNCSSGYCAAPSCAGTACTYGYAYGQCCATEPYCANYSGASSLVCRSVCGANGERCGYHTDCCSGNCVSGTCAVASCAGTACSYGYAYGGCCATQPYCVNYYSQPTQCRATCGQPSEHCIYNSDCCSNSCVYNSGAGWNTCN